MGKDMKANSMLKLLQQSEASEDSSSESDYEDMKDDPLMPTDEEVSAASLSPFRDIPPSPKKKATRKPKAATKEAKSLEEQLKEKLKDVKSVKLMHSGHKSKAVPNATIKKLDSDAAKEILDANPALVTYENGQQKIFVLSSQPAGVRTLQDGLSWMQKLLPSLTDLELLRFMLNKSTENVPEEIAELFKKSQWRSTEEATKKLRLRLSKKKRKQPAPPKPTMPTIREEPKEESQGPPSPMKRRRVMAPSPEPIPPSPPKRPEPLPTLPDPSACPSITVGTPSEELGQNFTGLFTDCHFELKISGTADQVREQGKRFFALL